MLAGGQSELHNSEAQRNPSSPLLLLAQFLCCNCLQPRQPLASKRPLQFPENKGIIRGLDLISVSYLRGFKRLTEPILQDIWIKMEKMEKLLEE